MSTLSLSVLALIAFIFNVSSCGKGFSKPKSNEDIVEFGPVFEFCRNGLLNIKQFYKLELSEHEVSYDKQKRGEILTEQTRKNMEKLSELIRICVESHEFLLNLTEKSKEEGSCKAGLRLLIEQFKNIIRAFNNLDYPEFKKITRMQEFANKVISSCEKVFT